jgi:hypothetical protein
VPWLRLLPALIAAVASARGAPEPLIAVFALPAVAWLPGRGFAARWSRDPLERLVLAFWLSALLAVPGVLVAVVAGLGPMGVLAFSATATALGDRLPSPRSKRTPGGRFGLLAVCIAVLFVVATRSGDLLRPLDGYWWFPPAESAWEGKRASVLPTTGGGWRERDDIGWEGAHAQRLVPRGAAPFLLGPSSGPFVIALRGPTGATLTVEAGGEEKIRIDARVEEAPDEGAVDRYLTRGVAAMVVDKKLAAGEKFALELSHPFQSVVYVLGGPDAVWALHEEGELRYTHYYQLLNIVEQLRWSQELFSERRVTDVQPPLPSYVLAAPLAVTAGELPTANLLFLVELLLIGAASVSAILAWSRRSPLLTLLFPAAAVVQHGRLMLEPGSAMLPDTLYTLAVIGSVGALAHSRGRFVFFGLLAQLCRYPGTLVALLAAGLAARPGAAVRLALAVAAAMLAFGIGGRVSGSLPQWIETVAWETGPEHWHGEHDPAVLLGRAPRFYGLWLAYAGGLPLLAALKWPKGTRVALGTALLYSLLLCTIDHTPSHYFLPLLHLSAIAAAISAGSLERPLVRLGFSLAGLTGMFVACTWAPIVG